MANHDDEQLREIAQIQTNSQRAVEKIFHRGPFMLGLICLLFTATVAGATWTTIIQVAVTRHEKELNDLRTDNKVGVLEQIHINSERAVRNKRQIRALNERVFGYPDAGDE